MPQGPASIHPNKPAPSNQISRYVSGMKNTQEHKKHHRLAPTKPTLPLPNYTQQNQVGTYVGTQVCASNKPTSSPTAHRLTSHHTTLPPQTKPQPKCRTKACQQNPTPVSREITHSPPPPADSTKANLKGIRILRRHRPKGIYPITQISPPRFIINTTHKKGKTNLSSSPPHQHHQHRHQPSPYCQ